MSQQELTTVQLIRQDIVDGQILNLMARLAPEDALVEYNIEAISRVREAIKTHLVDELGLMTAQEFYPFLEEEEQPDEESRLILRPAPEYEYDDELDRGGR